MPSHKAQAFMDIEYVSANAELNVWYFTESMTRPKRKFPKFTIDKPNVDHLINEYWRYVDREIKQNIFSVDNSEKQARFLDELKALGNEISNAILSVEMQKEIWRTAAESDIFVISTNIPEVPFEALYSTSYGENGTFLSDNCVIQRQTDSEDEIAVDLSVIRPSNTVVCIDPVLSEADLTLRQQLLEELDSGRVSLVDTSTKRAFSDSIKNALLIHWICEHSREGLRLHRDVFFRVRDISVTRFPQASVVFMLSCAAARVDTTEERFAGSISAGIAAANGCTVVAPSSVVAAKTAVRFVIDIERIAKTKKLSSLCDIWTTLKHPLGGRRHGSSIEPRDCYLLWFGIYGDCNVELDGVVQ